MILTPPSFFDDWGRHGFGAAWKKRWSKIPLGERRIRGVDLFLKHRTELVEIAGEAARAGDHLVSSWAFEALLVDSANREWACVRAIVEVLPRDDRVASMAALEAVLGYVAKDELTGTSMIGTETFQLTNVLLLTPAELEALLDEAISRRETSLARWTFLGLMMHADGDQWRPWRTFIEKLNGKEEQAAVLAARELLVFAQPYATLKQIDHGVWGSYVVGKAFLEKTEAVRGSNKSSFLELRPMAMHFLGQAREKTRDPDAASEPATGDPYRTAAMLASIGALAAVAYETGFYMGYKGQRDVSASTMSE